MLFRSRRGSTHPPETWAMLHGMTWHVTPPQAKRTFINLETPWDLDDPYMKLDFKRSVSAPCRYSSPMPASSRGATPAGGPNVTFECCSKGDNVHEVNGQEQHWKHKRPCKSARRRYRHFMEGTLDRIAANPNEFDVHAFQTQLPGYIKEDPHLLKKVSKRVGCALGSNQ